MLHAACFHAAAKDGQPAAHPPANSAVSSLELADVVRRFGEPYRQRYQPTRQQAKVLACVVRCRTAALGGVRQSCAACGYARYVYRSCRNRHCPKCQSLAKARWLEQRQSELLPVGYFHNVFTLPHDINPLLLCCERNRRVLLDLLFSATAATLRDFGRNNLGGQLGFTLVLHTWDQQLRPHFHLHALIAGGALAADGSRWISSRKNFLFPVRALSRVFRGKYLEGLERLLQAGQLKLPPKLAALAQPRFRRRWLRGLRKSWVVYSKAPFAGPQKLLDYLGHYTHRVAISNHRLLKMDDHQVWFSYRDRRDGDRQKVATVSGEEFLRRFLTHVLPERFMRIRHYGFLANRHKQQALALCRKSLGVEPPSEESPTEERPQTAAEWMLALTGVDITRCPQCGEVLAEESLPALEESLDTFVVCTTGWATLGNQPRPPPPTTASP